MEPEIPAQTRNPYAAPGEASPPVAPGISEKKTSFLSLLFSFEGRIPRNIYWGVTIGWWVVLFFGVCVLVIILAILESTVKDGDIPSELSQAGVILLIPYILSYVWSSWAITAKRYHDRGKSGWTQLLGLIPYIGGLIVLVECGFLEGNRGPNAYGPDPKTVR